MINGKKVIATIEARMGSSRLPGKMAMELFKGLPALGAVIERLSACKKLDGVIVATTEGKENDAIVDIAKRFAAMYFRGKEDDVLGRVVEAGRAAGADILVLVTGDASCTSPSLTDEGVDFFIEHDYDFVSNVIETTYPFGIVIQVADHKSLKKARQMADGKPYRDDTNNFEHTNFFIVNHPDIFKIYEYVAPAKYNRPDVRVALDTAADLDVIRGIYRELYPGNKFFDIDDILKLLEEKPYIWSPLEGLNIKKAA
ncbi:MAG: hypothetical protein A2Z72_08365 [Omnitrophica bacterium RBG_13_46_9]|nr:MAG: hypothetical protein A2Z72_08365 [Omnitrophica bacterium RBG_13_46_9]